MYEIAASALLSDDAARLDVERLDAEQRVAERVLGLRGTTYTGTAKQEAEDALALQVSLQVAADPMAYLASGETKGIQSVTWRGTIPIHPLALTIAESLFAENLGAEEITYPAILSLR